MKDDWSSSTSYMEKTKFLVSRTLNKHLTLYFDKDYFYIRILYSDVNTFASEFSEYEKIFTPRVGHLCACLNFDETVLYFQDTQDYLVSYNLSSSTLTTVGNVPFGVNSLDSCYYDRISNSIVYVEANFAMQKYSLDQLAFIDS